jgi:hypothetical protein
MQKFYGRNHELVNLTKYQFLKWQWIFPILCKFVCSFLYNGQDTGSVYPSRLPWVYGGSILLISLVFCVCVLWWVHIAHLFSFLCLCFMVGSMLLISVVFCVVVFLFCLSLFCISCPMLPVSQDCQFLNTHSVSLTFIYNLVLH